MTNSFISISLNDLSLKIRFNLDFKVRRMTPVRHDNNQFEKLTIHHGVKTALGGGQFSISLRSLSETVE